MKVSREKVAENRQKILDAASTQFRARGFEAVTVAEVMKAAGLTHGGFYGYFKSKDDLIAQTLSHVFAGGTDIGIDPLDYATRYLTTAHRDDLAGGCPLAGLGAEVIRQAPEARAAVTTGVRKQIDRLSRGTPGKSAEEARQAAIGRWMAMVGAVIIARLVDDPELSEELLQQTHAWIKR